MLKVLHLGRFNHEKLKGGVQAYVQRLIRAMDGRVKSDNLVANREPSTEISSDGQCRIYEVASYGLVQSTPIAPGLFFWAHRLVRREQYDIIHLNFPDPLGLLVAATLPRKIPVVVTWHSDVVKQRYALFLYLPILRWFMKRVTAVLVATPKHYDSCPQLRSTFKKRDRVFVVPFGVEPDRFKLRDDQKSTVSAIRERYAGRTLLFSLGRHVYYKGFSYLIEALKDLKDAVLLLGGSGPLTQELYEEVERLGLSSRVIFLGQMPDEKIPIYLHACDIFCFPSVDPSEAFGFAQIEAMLSHKPVICCELGNGVNYVNVSGVTGLAVPPRDVMALRGAIRKLIDHPELRRSLGEQAYNRAVSEFAMSKMADGVIGVYHKVLEFAASRSASREELGLEAHALEARAIEE
jgi:glycosyltransferase involved in cell wall biosynthesis